MAIKVSKMKRIVTMLMVISMMFVTTSCQIVGTIKNLVFSFELMEEASETTDPPVSTDETADVTAEDQLDALPCVHVVEGEGMIVAHEDGYARQHQCKLCGETLLDALDVVSVSDKWLFNEEAHWNDIVVCEEIDGEASEVSAGERKNNRYQVNLSKHELDENGVCSSCYFNSRESQGLEFAETPDGNGYIVVGMGECKDKHINIPKQYNGKDVVGIADGAFADMIVSEENSEEKTKDDSLDVETLELMSSSKGMNVEIENGLVIVGVTIPDTVISISCTAFSKCKQLNNFIVDIGNTIFKAQNNCLINAVDKSLVRGCEFSVIPEDGSVTVIGSYAFAGCETLVSVTIPDSIESIEDKAFFECKALVEVRMPDTVDLGVDVFRGSIHVEIKVDHHVVFVGAKEPTCDEAGNVAYYLCEDCGYFYADKLCETRLYNVEIPAAHNFVDGVCDRCGKIQDELKIVYVSEIPYLGKFALGTMENAIGLPEKVAVKTADGVTHELIAKWDLSEYKKDVAGEYVIKGHLTAGNLHFDEGVSSIVEARIEIVEFMKGTADIVFVLDISGSMGDEINNVKNNIVAFANAVEAEGVSARWGAITYSDWTQGLIDGNPRENSIVVMNGAADWFISAEEYKQAINNIQLAYGGDGPETGVDGLMLANTLSTRQDARVFYILLTDADCKIDNHYGVTDLQDAANRLDADRVNVSVITSTNLYDHYAPLTDTTGGIQANIYGSFQNDLFNTLVPIIQNEVIA